TLVPSATQHPRSRDLNGENGSPVGRAMCLATSKMVFTRTCLKRNIFVCDFGSLSHVVMLRSALIKACGSTARGAAFTHVAAIATAAEQNQVLGNDFSAIFLFAALLIFPTRGLQAAFNVELGTFLVVLANDFSQPLPGDNVMPFGAVLPFA